MLKFVRLKPKSASQVPLLLCTPNFMPKSKTARHEHNPGECKADALTTELTAQNHAYSSPFFHACKTRASALQSTRVSMRILIPGLRRYYQVCRQARRQFPAIYIPIETSGLNLYQTLKDVQSHHTRRCSIMSHFPSIKAVVTFPCSTVIMASCGVMTWRSICPVRSP